MSVGIMAARTAAMKQMVDFSVKLMNDLSGGLLLVAR